MVGNPGVPRSLLSVKSNGKTPNRPTIIKRRVLRGPGGDWAKCKIQTGMSQCLFWAWGASFIVKTELGWCLFRARGARCIAKTGLFRCLGHYSAGAPFCCRGGIRGVGLYTGSRCIRHMIRMLPLRGFHAACRCLQLFLLEGQMRPVLLLPDLAQLLMMQFFRRCQLPW